MSRDLNTVSPPAVSVVIPCFNQGQYLDEAVDSVRAQSRADVEIIVVNDGSTDPATNERLRHYPHADRVLFTPNRGVGAARNAGIAIARGRYICALDADDVLMPSFFEKAAARLDADAAVAFVSPWLENFGDEDWIWKQERCDLVTLLSECTVCTAALVRTDVVRAVRGYDEGMPFQGYEDWDLWIRIVAAGFQGVILPEVLFRYRRRAGSMSASCTTGEPHAALMRYLHNKHRDLYERHMDAVLASRDMEIARVLSDNDRLERAMAVTRQTRAERQAEHDRIRIKTGDVLRSEGQETLARELDAARSRCRDLESELARVTAEVHALRASRSWRITAPLRAVYRRLARVPH